MDLEAIHRSLYPYAATYPALTALPERGRDRAEVLAELTGLAAVEDAKWEGGRASGTIYSGDHEHYDFLSRCYALFAHTNTLQRDLCPSMSRFESEIIAMSLDLMHGEAVLARGGGEQPCGVVTSGGSESILTAVLGYRNLARQRGAGVPKLICPDTAHPAFDKAAHLFGLDLVTVPTDPVTTAVDVGAVRAALDEHGTDVAAVVGSAGNYPYGTIDPIAELSDLVLERGSYLHVDGCLGGWILPFGEELGVADIPPFDFRLPGVSSISADTHKYGYGPKGGSVLLWRDLSLRRSTYHAAPRWKGGLYASPGLPGSRSGGLVAATWASLVTLGRAGYRERARRIFEVAAAMRGAVLEHPELRLFGRPTFCFAFTTTEESGLDVYHVNDTLAERGWRLNGLQNPDGLHLAVTGPQTRPGVVQAWTADLAAAMDHARTPGLGTPRSAAVYGVTGLEGGLAALPDEALIGLVGLYLDAVTAGPPS